MTFKDAIRAAHRSNVKKHKTGAAVYDSRGNLLAIGWSHTCRHLVTTPRSMHAEHHALSRVPPGSKPHAVVIATLTKAGRITSGKPCRSCARLLEKRGIQEVHYTQRIED